MDYAFKNTKARSRAALKVSLLLCTALSVSVTAQAAEFKMKLATATVNDVQTFAIKRFAERVEKRSSGRISTELYPAAQLGSNARMIEGLQLGTVEVYVGPPAYLGGVDSRFQITDAPGIFDDIDHVQQVFSDDEFRTAYLALGEAKGMIGLSLFVYGPTAFATKEPVKKLSDFSGMKLRVLGSKMERVAADRIGATAIPIDFSEVVPALQQGTIDGMKSGMTAFTSLSLFDVVKHVTRTNEAVISEVLMVSKIWWSNLPKDLQAILKEEGRAMEPELFDYALKDRELAYKKWADKGGSIYQFPADEQAEMMKRLSKTSAEVLGTDENIAQMYNLMTTVANKYR